MSTIREILGLRPIKEFDQWLEKMGISENGKLTKYAGDPTLFYKEGRRYLMNIDEALIERIIREVVSQVVAEKAAGSGQNRSASGNNQNSMQSVNLGQIEQLVKNVASGDRQTSSGGQTSNAGGYHPEEPVHDVDIEEDITSREVKKRPLIDQPQDPEALERMMRLTTARIGVGCAGPRLKTQTLLTLRADHARARDARLCWMCIRMLLTI